MSDTWQILNKYVLNELKRLNTQKNKDIKATITHRLCLKCKNENATYQNISGFVPEYLYISIIV